MKICHLIFDFPIGGAETMLVDIVNRQIETEQISLIIVNDNINSDLIAKIDKRVTIYRLNRRLHSKNPLFIFKLNYLLYKIKPEVIHSHSYLSIIIVLPAFRKISIFTNHDVGKRNAKILKKFKKIAAISESVKQDMLVHCRIESEVVYNGIDVAALKVRDNFATSDKIFKIIQISRLYTEKKGQHLLIDAVDTLIHKHNINHIHVDFIGEGESFLELNKMVLEKQLENHITFAGNKNRSWIYSHICEYDLLVQPSLWEGFGLTVVEGMAAKVPVLVSDIEGPMEIINNGRYGHFFKTGDANDLAEKILYCISSENNENNKQMIENACQYVLTNFDVNRTAMSYICKYKELIQKK
jgi:glycosyltransferase involved in cell wall biosynthesis